MAITRAEVDNALDAAEQQFAKCWEYLLDIKGRKFSDAKVEPLIEFQPVLAAALFDLSRMHARIAEERKLRINAKTGYARDWFGKRMAFLSKQQDRLIAALEIGRSIGDAFAWFFYQNDAELLQRHAQEPRSTVMSTGVGGVGELESVRGTRMFGKYFVLHHCTTSMLRLGDISLVDLDGPRVAGTGEMKSHSDQPGHVTVAVQAFVSGPEEKLPVMEKVDATPQRLLAVTDLLSPSAKARLKRQMERIKSSHRAAAKTVDSKMMVKGDYRVAPMNRLLKKMASRRSFYLHAGGGLVLFGIRCRASKLSSLLAGNAERRSGSLERAMTGLDRLVDNAGIPDRNDNAAVVEPFYYNERGSFDFLPGMTHPFWWPIDLVGLEDIVFKRLTVISIYNPVWLFKQLEEVGFTVDTSSVFKPIITRNCGEVTFLVEGFAFHLRSITGYMTDESTVVQTLLAAYEATLEKSGGQQEMRINLQIRQKLFGGFGPGG